MPFKVGEGEIWYDHLGEWDRVITASLHVPDAVGGHPSNPGVMQPGLATPGGKTHELDVQFTLREEREASDA